MDYNLRCETRNRLEDKHEGLPISLSSSFLKKNNIYRGRGTGGGAMGACAPPLLLKVFWAKVPHLKNEKSIS
jgi:hypothetical protein